MSLAYWGESEQAVEKLVRCAHLIDHTWVFQNLSQVSLILKLCIPTSKWVISKEIPSHNVRNQEQQVLAAFL